MSSVKTLGCLVQKGEYAALEFSAKAHAWLRKKPKNVNWATNIRRNQKFYARVQFVLPERNRQQHVLLVARRPWSELQFGRGCTPLCSVFELGVRVAFSKWCALTYTLYTLRGWNRQVIRRGVNEMQVTMW
jgi:hypothetical protein